MKLVNILLLFTSLFLILSTATANRLSNEVNTENNRIKRMFSEHACLAELKEGKIYLTNVPDVPVDYGTQPDDSKLKNEFEPRYVYHHPSKSICIFYRPFLEKAIKGFPPEVKFNHGNILDDLEADLITMKKAERKRGSIFDFIGGELWIQNGDLQWINNESGFFVEIIRDMKGHFEKFIDEGMLDALTDKTRVERIEDYKPTKGGIGKRIIYKAEKKRKLRKIK